MRKDRNNYSNFYLYCDSCINKENLSLCLSTEDAFLFMCNKKCRLFEVLNEKR